MMKSLLKTLQEEAYLRSTKPNYEHLAEILARQKMEGEYSYSGPSYNQAFSDKLIDDFGGSWLSRSIQEVQTPDGPRNYLGEDMAFDRNTSRQLSSIDAALRSVMFPADSITTDELRLLQRHGLFEDK